MEKIERCIGHFWGKVFEADLQILRFESASGWVCSSLTSWTTLCRPHCTVHTAVRYWYELLLQNYDALLLKRCITLRPWSLTFWPRIIGILVEKVLPFINWFSATDKCVHNEDVLGMMNWIRLDRRIQFEYIYIQLYMLVTPNNDLPRPLHRFVFICQVHPNKPKRSHVIDLYKSYNMSPLDSLYNQQLLTFVFKCLYHIHLIPRIFCEYFIYAIAKFILIVQERKMTYTF